MGSRRLPCTLGSFKYSASLSSHWQVKLKDLCWHQDMLKPQFIHPKSVILLLKAHYSIVVNFWLSRFTYFFPQFFRLKMRLFGRMPQYTMVYCGSLSQVEIQNNIQELIPQHLRMVEQFFVGVKNFLWIYLGKCVGRGGDSMRALSGRPILPTSPHISTCTNNNSKIFVNKQIYSYIPFYFCKLNADW